MEQDIDTIIKELFKTCADKLERSGHGGKGGLGSHTSLKRTSKQTWIEHRRFDLNLTEIQARVSADVEHRRFDLNLTEIQARVSAGI